MIPGSPAPAIAAMIMRARRKIAGHFFVHHATSAEDAVAFAAAAVACSPRFGAPGVGQVQ